MPAPFGHFLASFVRGERYPLRADHKIRWYLQQRIKDKRSRLGNGLLHRQHADDVIADTEMIAFGFDVGVDDLVVEKLR